MGSVYADKIGVVENRKPRPGSGLRSGAPFRRGARRQSLSVGLVRFAGFNDALDAEPSSTIPRERFKGCSL
jgi:hypothetical protein